MMYGSVCSGIEAATVAWAPLGWRAQFLSEIEKFPSAVLAHHYPEIPNLGDMTKFKEWPDAAIDVLVGGTPCQSFSVAGLRKGLADPRGNLMLTYLAIADRYRPHWLVWENVPGVLSSGGGRDFGTFLGGLGQLGYGFAYRVLDAQYFGVPQRRRRVFVVGCLGDWRAPAAVLFERHSLQWNTPPRREAGEGVAAALVSGSQNGSPWHGARSGTAKETNLTARTLSARHDGSACADRGPDVVAIHGTQDPCVSDNAFALGRNSGQENAIAFAQNSRDEVRLQGVDGGVCGAIGANEGMKQRTYIAESVSIRGREGGASAELSGEVATALRASQGGGDKPHVLAPVAWSEELTAHQDIAGTLQRGGDGGRHDGVMTQSMQVRRLTPRECERLQGFPDDYTRIPWKAGYWPADKHSPEVRAAIAEQCPDGPRYKALGNSMAVPVMRWIGERIQMVSEVIAS